MAVVSIGNPAIKLNGKNNFGPLPPEEARIDEVAFPAILSPAQSFLQLAGFSGHGFRLLGPPQFLQLRRGKIQ